jgi:hypothetical protein
MSEPPFLSEDRGKREPAHKLEIEEERRELEKFASEVRKRPPSPVGPGPNQVVVTDGMGNSKLYSSITAGMNSITDASPSNEYSVTVGIGTYNEQLVMKSWVTLTGAGAGQTVISSGVPTVRAAANSSVQLCTLQAIGKSSDTIIYGVFVLNSPKFALIDCTIVANDAQSGRGANIVTLAVDWPNGSAGVSTCYVMDCIVQATGVNGAENATAAVVGTGALLQIESTTLVPSGTGVYGLGGASVEKATLDLGWCTVSGSAYALYCDTTGATCVARGCTIEGAVTPNVKIIKEGPHRS